MLNFLIGVLFMTKKYIEEEIIPHLEIKNGNLFFNEELISIDNNLEFKKKLSYGANGVTFVVFHKLLKLEQLIKIYFITDDISKTKALTESQKNSTLNMADSTARVYDVGILNSPVEIVYSKMEFIENSMTLKDYLTYRRTFISILKEVCPNDNFLKHKSILGPLFQESINIATYFIRSVAYLIKNHIRHGDLNPGNILICNSMFTPQLLRDIELYQEYKKNSLEDIDIDLITGKLKNYFSIYGNNDIRIGEIEQENLSVKLIDLGASQIEPSSIEKTNQRDSWFIYHTIDELLSPFFEEIENKGRMTLFAFFKLTGKYPVKKIEYYFPFEKLSNATDGKYISQSGDVFHVHDGKIEIPNHSSENYHEIFRNLIDKREIFFNGQVIPYPMQHCNISKDLMFVEDKTYNAQIPYQMMASELLKIIALVNIYYGLIYQGNTLLDDDILKQEIQNIIFTGILDDEGEVPDRNITLSPLFDYRFYEAANILLRKNKDGKLWSNNLLFDYNNLLHILNNSLH